MSRHRKVKAAAVSGHRTFDTAVEDTPVLIELAETEIAVRAYSYWEARGQPVGSAEEDWYRAIKDLTAEMQRSSREDPHHQH
jgi:hypothetical protein